MTLDFTLLPLAFRFTSPGPIVFQLGPITVRWYGLLIATAVLLGVTLSQYLAKRRDVNPDLLSDLSIWLIIGAIPAARLYYVIFQWSEYAQV
jgi:phosphatidylglycerol---prolipoprotein diacylglyceryl transferase